MAKGEVVGSLGPNGAGKTTSIRVMLGLTWPTAGEARLFGGDPDRHEARGRVGVMLPRSGVPSALRVREVVELFARYDPFALPTDEVLGRAGLDAKARAIVSTLSGGQRQRLYFTLAVVGDPDLHFFDEPTVALDVEGRRAYWEQVVGFAELGKTVLFTTHHLSEADAVARRLAVIDKGRIVAEGTPSDVKRRVADRTVRFRSDLPASALTARPDVQRFEMEPGGLMTVFTSEPERLLRDPFAQGAELRDLTVIDADLEAAFMALTSPAGVAA